MQKFFNGSILLLCLYFITINIAQAAKYSIDKTHTYVTFEITHQNTSTNRVRFNDINGKIEFDAKKKKGFVNVVINPANPDSGSDEFNEHLKSSDIFNVAKFKEIKFKSKKFIFNKDKISFVEGDLSLLGVKNPVVLKAINFNCYESPFTKKEVCGGDFEVVIDRTHWGLNYALNYAAKDVRIIVQIEAEKK